MVSPTPTVADAEKLFSDFHWTRNPERDTRQTYHYYENGKGQFYLFNHRRAWIPREEYDQIETLVRRNPGAPR